MPPRHESRGQILVSRGVELTKRSAPALELDAAKLESKRRIGGGWSLSSSTFSTSLSHLSPLLSFLFPLLSKNTKQAVKLKTKKRPKKLTPSDKKHVGATYPALPPPPPAFTILKAGASN